MTERDISFIDRDDIIRRIDRAQGASDARIRDILAKAKELGGLNADEAATLCGVKGEKLCAELFDAARQVKETIYGKRLVLFAPLYISNLCRNECSYCAFRAGNDEIRRRTLDASKIAAETRALVDQGHKRVLLVAGEAYPEKGFQYVLDAIDAIYDVKRPRGSIRRINVNIAPLEVDQFAELSNRQIGTYQLFQETYDPVAYEKVHVAGPKKNYRHRLGVMDRAMRGGIDDVGIGALFGLADWRFEILGLLEHAAHLESRFGIGPHTISVPRLEPASGSKTAARPPHPVSDFELKKIVAILRLAVPYTGIIMSTRESAAVRRETFSLGVSQISAGSRTNPGGYCEEDDGCGEQFSLGDHRPLEDVVRDAASLGYIPSFCTACYRLGRTGADFMDLARPGEIKTHCDPNAVATFAEYLFDCAAKGTREEGYAAIKAAMKEMEEGPRRVAKRLSDLVDKGEKDVFW